MTQHHDLGEDERAKRFMNLETQPSERGNSPPIRKSIKKVKKDKTKKVSRGPVNEWKPDEMERLINGK